LQSKRNDLSGLYIHIPFCKQACHYCDFHFSTQLAQTDRMVQAICRELELRCHEIRTPLETIYFGGGTPSLLSGSQLEMIMHAITTHFQVVKQAEITLEANPEDCTNEKLAIFKQLGINRLSLGVQSFENSLLQFSNRAHSTHQAIKAIEAIQSVAFFTMTVDLMFGFPSLPMAQWEKTLDQFLIFDIPHVSVYGLTIEDRTVFGNWSRKNKMQRINDEDHALQFAKAHDILTHAGYRHYEISNYAKEGHESKHNASYWSGKAYLGVGPAAHSFDGGYIRRENVRNNARYTAAMEKNQPAYTEEHLSATQRMNEQVMTGLRTSKGIDAAALHFTFGKNLLLDHEPIIQWLAEQNFISLDGSKLCLTNKGMHLADEIALKLFYDD